MIVINQRQNGHGAGVQDAFALESQRRWGAAHAAGRFAAELCAVELDGGGKGSKRGDGAPRRFETDEHPRPDTTAEAPASKAAR